MTTDLETLRARLIDPVPETRLRAALALAREGSLAGRAVVLEALTLPHPADREEAIAVLGTIGALWTIDPLASAIFDTCAGARMDATHALAGTHRIEAVPHLIDALGDDDPERRELARLGLGWILGPAMSALLVSETFHEVTRDKAVAQDWWRANHPLFDACVCYEEGAPVWLGHWVTELRSRPDELSPSVESKLRMWTGHEVVSETAEQRAVEWEAWWHANQTQFPRGRRYFWGRDAETLA